MLRSLILLAVVCSPLLADEPVPFSDTWTEWRGPNRDGVIPETIPESFDGFTQKWRVELGPSYSGPLVTEDRVFVTETKDRKEEVTRALDRATGEEIWSSDWKGAMTVPFFAAKNGSWIRATPALADDRLYVAGMRDVLGCLDANTGEQVWRVDFVDRLETPLPAFGFVSSPLVDGEHIYVQAGASFAKLDRETGKILWRTLTDKGGTYGSAFSSPVMAELQGVKQLVVQTRAELAGVDPEDGTVLWSTPVEAFRGMNILTPTIVGNRVFTSTYGGGSFLFEISQTDDGFSAKRVWRSKLQGYMSSPVVIEGHIYMHLRNQRFACVDLETGDDKWITTPFGDYWSLLTDGERILALDSRGVLRIIAANPNEYEQLAEKKVAEQPTWAHVAVVGKQVFIRELTAMAVWEWK